MTIIKGLLSPINSPLLTSLLKSSEGPVDLSSIVDSTVFDLDFTIAQSYPGTGTTLFNLVNTPADGSLKSAYDMEQGGAGSISFEGTAGTPSAYALLTASVRYQLSANTDFINNLHKTTGGSDFWYAVAFRFIQSDTNQITLGTQNSLNDAGLSLYSASTEAVGFRQGSGSGSTFSGLGTSTMVDGTDYLLIGSHSHSSNLSRFWLNTTTGQQNNHTFTATTNDAAYDLSFGSGGNSGSSMPDNTRLYGAYGGNSFISDVEAALIFELIRNRHGRAYA